MGKLSWEGIVTAVQPRIRLLRSFDERGHTYLGYVLHIDGEVDGDQREFILGVGKAAHQTHQFRIGDSAQGLCEVVARPEWETSDFYKVSKLQLTERRVELPSNGPPWFGPAPDLTVYRSRGHRRLRVRTYDKKCMTCIWGCRMPVEMIIDHWNPSEKRYRTETFCYGPKSCPSYKPGPTRKVPGRRGMMYEEPDWLDEQATNHREPDE